MGIMVHQYTVATNLHVVANGYACLSPYTWGTHTYVLAYLQERTAIHADTASKIAAQGIVATARRKGQIVGYDHSSSGRFLKVYLVVNTGMSTQFYTIMPQKEAVVKHVSILYGVEKIPPIYLTYSYQAYYGYLQTSNSIPPSSAAISE